MDLLVSLRPWQYLLVEHIVVQSSKDRSAEVLVLAHALPQSYLMRHSELDPLAVVRVLKVEEVSFAVQKAASLLLAGSESVKPMGYASAPLDLLDRLVKST